jgi:formylglycine-generating enzyme required for sulfatase activity
MGRGSRPVISIEYEDALAYANCASEKYGIKLRLPTEAEWENACWSGGKEQRYCGGDDPKRYAVFDQKKTELVGSKEPNGLGLCDMSGNAFEMTCSPYADSGQYVESTYEGAELR